MAWLGLVRMVCCVGQKRLRMPDNVTTLIPAREDRHTDLDARGHGRTERDSGTETYQVLPIVLLPLDSASRKN
jgi:hypothetical protein